ncbi:MAG TPA: ROK family protein [Alphaproteobacteria bacterium]
MGGNAFVGVDLGGTKIEVAVLDLAGGVIFRKRAPTPPQDYDATLDAVSELVAAADETAGATPPVGIGIPGAISPATGLVKNANSTWLNGRPFDRDIARRLDRAVRVANDANCFAMSEASDGAAAGLSPVFGVILGTGVGGGIVVEGRILTGADAIAGEWGHTPLPYPADDERPGERCWCGRSGCLETWLSGPALMRDHERRTGRRWSPAQIASAADAGDAGAEAALARYADRLARGLSVVVNILDPAAIVLGGGLSNLARLYGSVPPLLEKLVFSDRLATRLLPPMHGDSSGVRGAARLWT